MIKINLVCVGKVKEKYFTDAINEYSKRLSRFCEFKIIEVTEENFISEPSVNEIPTILKKESVGIQKNLKGYIVAMCIEGKKMSSEVFADTLKSLKDKGQTEITFVIGGSYGMDNVIKGKADLKLSFSDMTFPHTLMRVILVEQIYRAFMINSSSNYHK